MVVLPVVVLPEVVLPEVVLPEVVLPVCTVPWVPGPGDGPSVGLPPVLPADGGPDVDDADPEEVGVAELVLADADADAVALGLLVAFVGGVGLVLEA